MFLFDDGVEDVIEVEAYFFPLLRFSIFVKYHIPTWQHILDKLIGLFDYLSTVESSTSVVDELVI